LSEVCLMKPVTEQVDGELFEILQVALQNEQLTEKEICRLLLSEPEELPTIALIADYKRWLEVGDIVTYVRNRNINFTNICIGSCMFCGFRRDKDDEDAYVLSPEEIARKTAEAVWAGATEVCLQGGLHPDFGLSDYLKILDSVRSVSKSIHIHAFSPEEIEHICRQEGMDVFEVLCALREHGLDSVPGTAAEILSDNVREKICPRKVRTKRWTEIVKACHSLGIPTTSTIMYGTIETYRERAKHLLLIRKIQEETSGFTEFVLLPFVSSRTPLGKAGLRSPSMSENIKMHAVARLVLGDVLKNIQTSYVKLGLEGAKAALMAGANDLGGTLMEENITSAAGGNVRCMKAEELEELARAVGRIPAERTTTYRLIRIC